MNTDNDDIVMQADQLDEYVTKLKALVAAAHPIDEPEICAWASLIECRARDIQRELGH
jgi:hypothetical protein